MSNGNNAIDLYEYMTNKDEEHYWSAGGQLNALSFYLGEGAEILAEWMEDGWQGECAAIIKFTTKGSDVYVLWRDSFGSCAGCDALEDQDGFEYIKSTLSPGNTVQFESLEDLAAFSPLKTEYWGWGSVTLSDLVRDALEKESD